MTDLNAQFHFSLARITTIQLLRSTGVDRARASVVDSLTDLLTRYLVLLAQRSRESAESAGRHRCELEDLRQACESLGTISVTAREEVREEEGVLQFITWCMSDEVTNMRRVAGEGKDEMGEDTTADWLEHLIKAQVKVSGEDIFKGTVIDPQTTSSQGEKVVANPSNGRSRHTYPPIVGMESFKVPIAIPDVVRDYANST